MTPTEVAGILDEAGFSLVDLGVPEGVISLEAARMLPECFGEYAWESVLLKGTDAGPRFNAEWHGMAEKFGLFGAAGDFLLAIPEVAIPGGGVSRWATVRLSGDWDVFGSDTGIRLFGASPGSPDFMMSSLDGSVVLRGVVWRGGSQAGCLAMREPFRSRFLRDYIQLTFLGGAPAGGVGLRSKAEAWLLAGEELGLYPVRFEQGDAVCVPLAGGGYAMGVIARVGESGNALGYFFGPRKDRVPAVSELGTPRSSESAYVAIIGRESSGGWRNLGALPGFQAREYPLPKFCIPSLPYFPDDPCSLIEYDPRNLARIVSRVQVTEEECARHPLGDVQTGDMISDALSLTLPRTITA